VKIVGAILLLDINLSNKSSSIGLQVACQVLYGIALGPLLSASLSFVNSSSATRASSQPGPRYTGLVRSIGSDRQRLLRLTHLVILAGIALGVVGGVDRAPKSSNGQIDPSDYDNGATYLKVSSILFLVALVAVTYALFADWRERKSLDEPYPTLLTWMAFVLPFLLLRVIYSMLNNFNLDTTSSEGHTNQYNTFTGSWVIYLFLAMLPQIVVVSIYATAGLVGRRRENKGMA
jgi:hypothetical protein